MREREHGFENKRVLVWLWVRVRKCKRKRKFARESERERERGFKNGGKLFSFANEVDSSF